MINNTFTAELFAAGYVRCPNNAARLYPIWQGMKRVSMRDVIVTDAAITLQDWHGSIKATFPTTTEYLAFAEANGQESQSGPNVWD